MWNSSIFHPRSWISRQPPGVVSKIYDNCLRYKFYQYRCRYLPDITRKYSRFELLDTPPVADAFIAGSDQVWGPKYLRPNDDFVVWLGFGDEKARRISYAASFGLSDLADDICKKWSVFARKLNHVSVREKDGVDLVRKLGRNDAVFVPDPTLLLTAPEYRLIAAEDKRQKTPYIFLYLLGATNDVLAASVLKHIRQYSKIGASYVRLYSPHIYNLVRGLCGGALIDPGVWLTRLMKAEYVITNSFHGLVFCLLFHRPFIVLLRGRDEAKMNNRILSLLDVVGLSQRAIDKYECDLITYIHSSGIDWKHVDAGLAAFRKIGIDYLNDALS